MAALFIWGPRLISPSLARTRIRVARVEMGAVEETITAAGNVLPEIEQVISSPVDARVLKIIKRPGSALMKGDPILQLDLSQSQLAIEKINQQIGLKSTQQAKAKLSLENAMIDLQSRWEIKNLEYHSAQAATVRHRALFEQGLLSQERLRETELDEEKRKYELKQIEELKRNARQSTETELKGSVLEMATLERELAEARRQLEIATTKADRQGVLTWVVNEEGSTVRKGEVLARIADLSSFRVEATISDVHANRLSAGLPVKVRINDTAVLDGSIVRVNPTVTNGVMTMVVSLREPSNPLLRSNLRVDVSIEIGRKDHVLRIKKGPFATGDGRRDVFVIRGDTAIKTSATFGLAGTDHFEIKYGLLEGDEVIISDLTDYLQVKEIRLK
ncbi:MAG TPA: HlyD family efflux transporter periplasmic adaptor subunit [Blastocatellia bacterium]|nr:HlyD family efflux transporter periplasmic adaptor subunit [Blastocatellia bacterium]